LVFQAVITCRFHKRFTDKQVTIAVLSNLGTGEAFRKANAIAAILIDGGQF